MKRYIDASLDVKLAGVRWIADPSLRSRADLLYDLDQLIGVGRDLVACTDALLREFHGEVAEDLRDDAKKPG